MANLLIRSLIIYISVIIATRIMGKRQIGELNPHELVITILVSQTATLPLQDNNMSLANMFIPLLLFVSFEIIASALSMKSIHFRNAVEGKPIFIIKNGRLDEGQLKRLRFTVDDLIDSLRQKDAFDISEVQDAVIETNGSISVLKKAEASPVTPKQLRLSVDENSTPIAIVIDGKPVFEYFGKDKMKQSEIELIMQNENKKQEDILLLTIDDNGNTYLIPKRSKAK